MYPLNEVPQAWISARIASLANADTRGETASTPAAAEGAGSDVHPLRTALEKFVRARDGAIGQWLKRVAVARPPDAAAAPSLAELKEWKVHARDLVADAGCATSLRDWHAAGVITTAEALIALGLLSDDFLGLPGDTAERRARLNPTLCAELFGSAGTTALRAHFRADLSAEAFLTRYAARLSPSDLRALRIDLGATLGSAAAATLFAKHTDAAAYFGAAPPAQWRREAKLSWRALTSAELGIGTDVDTVCRRLDWDRAATIQAFALAQKPSLAKK